MKGLTAEDAENAELRLLCGSSNGRTLVFVVVDDPFDAVFHFCDVEIQ